VDDAQSLGWTIAVGTQNRDWRTRWAELNDEVAALENPLPDATRETVLRASRHLRVLVFEQFPSLRDSFGGTHQQVAIDQAIDQHKATMGLAHDLGNLSKHGRLNTKRNPPRSGHTPRFGHLAAEKVAASDHVRLRATIELVAGQPPLDALDLARAAIDDWRRHPRRPRSHLVAPARQPAVQRSRH
jgi:hypothetical protein